jgi:alkanesulfonate monooxygenase SsuD/methylene tetrahydromethanopterin reductase-like flavin-dependent oxidoreductase (luciferase family)
MNYGFVLPAGTARIAADFAREAEAAGWDGFFVWEAPWATDAWVSLAAAAMVTERIRLGTMLTALSRMRPWKLASETATLDDLSGGRVILSVGLGAPETGFAEFGEVTDRRVRAELLDEGLDILTGLWQGQPFHYEGTHYRVAPVSFYATPPPLVQKPRIPIWVVGAWPYPRSLARALRYDGLIPAMMDKRQVRMGAPTPAETARIKEYVDEHRNGQGAFDIVVEGTTPGDNPAAGWETVQPYVEAGATWWIEAKWDAPDQDGVLERIRQGPPRVGES